MKPQPWERLYAAKLSATPGYIELEIPNAMDIHSDRIRRDPISIETARRLRDELDEALEECPMTPWETVQFYGLLTWIVAAFGLLIAIALSKLK